MKKSILYSVALVGILFGVATEALAYDCVCSPGSKPWGCPMLGTMAAHGLNCGPELPVSPQACGQVSCNSPLNGQKTLNQDFFIDYNLKADRPAQCTAFAVHGGTIDKGVSDIIDGLMYCRGFWGKYEFSGPSMEYHVTETQFNEPCYGMLRSMGKTRIHIHSNVGAALNTICVGTKASVTAPNFITQLRAALEARFIGGVTVEYNGTGACANSPAKTGRDELGLEIQKDLAIQMGNEAGQCNNLSTRFGALVDALSKSFPSCFDSVKHNGQSTFPYPGCGLGY